MPIFGLRALCKAHTFPLYFLQQSGNALVCVYVVPAWPVLPDLHAGHLYSLAAHELGEMAADISSFAFSPARSIVPGTEKTFSICLLDT